MVFHSLNTPYSRFSRLLRGRVHSWEYYWLLDFLELRTSILSAKGQLIVLGSEEQENENWWEDVL